jgi:hypothetical protein
MSEEKVIVNTPEQYADLVIRDVEQAHLARKDDFLGVAPYRDQIIKHFKVAIQAAYTSGKRIGVMEYEKAQMEALDGN